MRVKICCISSAEEARLAVAAGAAALGLVGHMPSGPGVIADALIAEIAAAVPPGVSTFLLTSETAPEAIVAHWQRVRTTTVQLVDALPLAAYAPLRAALPGVRLVQVLHIRDEAQLFEARAVAPHVDALLLDSGNPGLLVKELGGTGRVHNWEISREIVRTCGRPVFLAGGLRPDNMAAALAAVQPFGLDLCTGVRTDGCLDADKLHRFFENVRRAGFTD